MFRVSRGTHTITSPSASSLSSSSSTATLSHRCAPKMHNASYTNTHPGGCIHKRTSHTHKNTHASACTKRASLHVLKYEHQLTHCLLAYQIHMSAARGAGNRIESNGQFCTHHTGTRNEQSLNSQTHTRREHIYSRQSDSASMFNSGVVVNAPVSRLST